MNDSSFEQELQETFLSEAEEMLDETEAAFVALEAQPDDSAKIGKIFRLVHTIKGSAHVAGFADLGTFAHVFETLLSALRESKLSVSPAVVDVLLEGNDRLKEFVGALRNDRSAKMDLKATETRIRKVLSNGKLPPHEAPRYEDKAATPSESALFLLVDDEPEILNLLGDELKKGGFRVAAFTDSIKALEYFHGNPVDAIFTDLKMPGMDGVALSTAVRKVNSYIPIGIISGHTSREHFKDYLRLNIDCFIEKPFNSEQVLTAARRLQKEALLRSSLLALSKVSFQAYVMFEKILSTVTLDESHESDRSQLTQCMEQMREATTNLLASERQLRAVK